MEIILPILASFIITVITTPLTIILAKRYNLIDNPKLRPHPAHVQNRIVPRAGGLPIFLGITIAISFFVPLDKHILGIILAIVILLAVGILDDLMTNLSPYPRLLMQFVAAAVVVFSGIGITFINNPLGGILRLDPIIYSLNFFGSHTIILIADLFAFFWIVWMMNMVNWSKGVDGQMPGLTLIASIIIGIFSYKLYLGGDLNQLTISILSFITAAASLGFLVFNWHPAKILPGQSASTILALMIATLSIMSGAKLAIALLVLLIPSVDFFYTFFRRILTGKLPFFGDKRHLHHLLLKKGWSHQQIALFYMLGSVILGWAALSLDSRGKLFASIALGAIILGGILWLNFFGAFSKQSDQDSG